MTAPMEGAIMTREIIMSHFFRYERLKACPLGIVLILFVATSLAPAATAQSASLDNTIRREMHRAHVPGLAAGIVKDGELVWAKGYGHANLAREIPVTLDTLFNLASVSKTITATAAMQLAEKGILDLDADVNAYLPFTVRHPRFRNRPITTRQLLTHTAGIQDDWDILEAGYVRGGDSPVALGDFLEDYLDPAGRDYKRSNFTNHAPGTRHEYSNVGYALLGYVVEAASGQPFDSWCNERIFAPLGMDETSWRLEGMRRARVAVPYGFRGGRYRPYGHYGYPDYPNGLLRSSVRELSRFVAAHLNAGSLDGERILLPRSARAMRTIQNPSIANDMGLGFFADTMGGLLMVGHDGGDDGVSTQMWFSRGAGIGVIVLTNGDADDDAESNALYRVLVRLIREAKAL